MDDGTQVIQAEGRTLKEAVEAACEMLAVPKHGLQYRLCPEHFRFGADTVKIEAWRKEASEIDAVARVQELAEGILRRMHVEAGLEVDESSDSIRVALDMDAKELGNGRLRDMLDAFGHVLSKSLIRAGSAKRVVVDLENYREQHDQGVRYVSQKVCEKVLKEGCVVTLKPMNAYDRRLVHLEVARHKGLGSKSTGGRGQMKRVQVFPLAGREEAS